MNARAKNSGPARFLTQQMESAFLASLDRTASQVEALGNGSSSSFESLLNELMVMEKLVNAVWPAESTSISTVGKEALDEVSRIERSITRVDTSTVLKEVNRAERNRIDRLEHETMSKLVNKMPDRGDLAGAVASMKDSIANFRKEAADMSETAENRRTVVAYLQKLIAETQASFEQDPSEEDLPPLDEVHPSILSL